MFKSRKSFFVANCAVALAAIAGTFAVAQNSKESQPTKGQPEMKLPAGWTTQDMQACMEAGMPGPMHEKLASAVGAWTGKSEMWMGPGADKMTSDCTYTVTSLHDGHFIQGEMKGEMMGMPFTGTAVTGYDNVSKKFVGTWIDNHSTGISTGTGDASKEGKIVTWTYTANCPITKQPTTMRQVETHNSPNSMTLEMWSTDPKSGKEFKCMHIDFTKKS